MRTIFFALFALFAVKNHASFAAEPFLKPNDVIALVGGEDMVVASELGYLETLLQRALPGHKLKFRSLAWEGDTVFEQPRDLNYPTLDAQLDKIGATVVICQFGQMESIAGKDKLPDFIAAYEKLIARIGSGGKRRVVIVPPTWFEFHAINPIDWTHRNPVLTDYVTAISTLATRLSIEILPISVPLSKGYSNPLRTKDGVHSDGWGHLLTASLSTVMLTGSPEKKAKWKALDRDPFAFEPATMNEAGVSYDAINQLVYTNATPFGKANPINALITAKNKLWYHYYRPQNWAFLAGDRTNQPSSRDHLDPKKRWFPEELEKFLPLIEAKEQEIWALADKLAAEGAKK